MSIWLGYQIVALFFGSKHSRHLQNSQWSHFLSFYRISQFLLSFWNHLFTTQLYTPTRPVTPALHFRLNNILSFETYLTIRKLIENLKKRKNRKNLLTIVIPRANHVKSQGRTCFPTVRVSECWFLQVLTRSDRYSLNDRCWNTDSKGQTILESNKISWQNLSTNLQNLRILRHSFSFEESSTSSDARCQKSGFKV